MEIFFGMGVEGYMTKFRVIDITGRMEGLFRLVFALTYIPNMGYMIAIDQIDDNNITG